MTVAVIYIPAAHHLANYADQCFAYCLVRGYAVTGVITTNWADVMAVMGAKAAQVIVVARPDHLDPDREPRIEVADDSPPPADPDDAERRRRPRLI